MPLSQCVCNTSVYYFKYFKYAMILDFPVEVCNMSTAYTCVLQGLGKYIYYISLHIQHI